MKKTIVSLALIMVCVLSLNAQILSESFSSTSVPSGWTQEDNHSYNYIQNWFWEFDGSQMKHVFYQSSMHYQADCWVFTPNIAMVSGQTYNISFLLNTNYDGMGLHGPASLEVKIGQGQSSGMQTTLLWSDANITNSAWVTKSFDYYCAVSGNYNYSIHCRTPKGGALNLGSDTYIDDVAITQSTSTNVENNNYLDLSIYPNPTNDIINIVGGNINNIKIYNHTGILLQEVISNANGIVYDLGNFPSGIYFIEVLQKDEPKIHKIILN
jgi:Secretion system C-terminal sorting domain